jgi:DNA-directed RNA polymerase specialized sigma24 family protein
MSLTNEVHKIDLPADRRKVEDAVAALPYRLRTVLIEVHFRDRSTADAAWILGISPATARARLREALPELRKLLDNKDVPIGDRWSQEIGRLPVPE